MDSQPDFAALGFRWDRDRIPDHLPRHTLARACFRFHHDLPQFVWEATRLAGNPHSFPEVKTLLDGVTVGGHRISDQAQVLNLAAATRWLLNLVKKGQFELSASIFVDLNAILAPQKGSRSRDLSPVRRSVIEKTIGPLRACNPVEQGCAAFLLGARHRFFASGNTLTAQLVMHGILLSHGIDAISIPPAKGQALREKMAEFLAKGDATDMMLFLLACHPDGNEAAPSPFSAGLRGRGSRPSAGGTP